MAAEHDIDVIVRDKFFPPRRLLGFLPDLKPRTIVEVGAAHPNYLSISASFRGLGWKVIAIEPNPKFCAMHRASGFEVLQYACSDEDRDDVDFVVVDSLGAEYMGGKVSNESFSSLGIKGKFEDLYSAVDYETTMTTIKVNARRLDTILSVHSPFLGRIDILAVDVEGWELTVIRGISLDRYKPIVIILENLFDDDRYREFMADRDYDLFAHIAPNDVFVRATK